MLGVLTVPGLPENRPSVVPGALVYLRFIEQRGREVAAVAAATEGDRVFLLLPPSFWFEPDAAALLPALRAAAAAAAGGGGGGNSSSSNNEPVQQLQEQQQQQQGEQRKQEQLSAVGAFGGLVHVRLTFDRTPLQRMHDALAAAATASPPGCTLVPPVPPQRLAELAPKAADVAAAAAALQEGGCRPLNAEQRQAVAAVLCGGGRSAPYALFGPPGAAAVLCSDPISCFLGGGGRLLAMVP